MPAPAITAVDAYGHRRSSRSIPTGPGSRGGRWHDPAFRAAYWREWRLEHPAYRARERQRMILKRQRAYHEKLRLDT